MYCPVLSIGGKQFELSLIVLFVKLSYPVNYQFSYLLKTQYYVSHFSFCQRQLCLISRSMQETRSKLDESFQAHRELCGDLERVGQQLHELNLFLEVCRSYFITLRVMPFTSFDPLNT